MCDYVNKAYEPTGDERAGNKNGMTTIAIHGNDDLHAVTVCDAWKSYGAKKTSPVLQGLNMNVKLGSIYALLGASGCGKTTLLSCIVARRKLDKGTIKVYGSDPGVDGSGVPGWRVGYMPQDIAMYSECSISEMFFFFGRIFSMSKSRIKEQIQFFRDFLKLPKPSRMIASLSGGQQRRVSFAIALLHDPQLLILDEPTVGVDPILRQHIWNHLVEITSTKQQTIIITTHYIEEARQATKVGMMHAGRLLAEESPTALLEKHNVPTLEDVFYKYCMQFETIGDDVAAEETTEGRGRRMQVIRVDSRQHIVAAKKNDIKQLQENLVPKTFKEKSVDTWNRTSAICLKAYSRLFRNIPLFLFVTLLPPFIIATFVIAYGADIQGLKVAVYNGEYPDEPICQVYDDCFFGNLSCRYLDALDQKLLTLVPYNTREGAEDALVQKSVDAVFLFAPNFSDSFQVRFAYGIQLEDLTTLNNSKINVFIDTSNFALSAIVQRAAIFAFQTFSKRLYAACEFNTELGELPVAVEDPIPENNNPVYSDYLVGPMMLFVGFFLPAMFATVHFIGDRQQGVLDRIAVAGVSASELIVGLAVNQFTVMFLQVILMCIVAFWVFGLPCYSGVVSVFLVACMHGLCGLSFGFMVAVSFDDEKAAYQLLLAVLYMVTLLGGILWPIQALPYYIRYCSYFLPSTFAMESVRNLMLRSWYLTHPEVWPGMATTVAWTVIFFAMTWISLKKINKL